VRDIKLLKWWDFMAELLKLLVGKKSGYSTQNSAFASETIKDHQASP
jgi:hypothetical protein